MADQAIDRVIELDDFDGDWNLLIEETSRRHQHVLLTRQGQPVLELVQPSEAVIEYRRAKAAVRLQENLEAMREAFADVEPEEHEREVAKAIAQMEWELYGHRRDSSLE